MRVMALGAIDLFLDQGMVLRQAELSFNGTMTFETRARIFARVDDESGAPTSGGDVQASRTMTRFAARLPCCMGIFKMNPGMSAAWEDAADIGMALGTSVVADETRAWNFRSGRYTERGR